MKPGFVTEAAAFAGVSRSYASRVVNGQKPWRRARTSLIRHLYQGGWCPKDASRAVVRRWLDRGGLTARDL